LEALGNKGKLILDVIPELELILKRDDIDTTKVFAPVVELGAAEAAVRFKAVFQDFINVFAQREHPLIIFLDDLHVSWNSVFNLVVGRYPDIGND
jgi:predicted ATPase